MAKKKNPAADAIKTEIEKRLEQFKEVGKELANKVLNTQEVQNVINGVRQAVNTITAYMQSEEYKAAKEALQQVAAYIREHKEDFETLGAATDHIKDLAPFLQEEIEADPEFTGTTIKQVVRTGFTIRGEIRESKYKPLIERAEHKLAEYIEKTEEITEIEQAAKELPKIIEKPTEKLDITTDIVNNTIWSLIARKIGKNDIEGQLSFQSVDGEIIFEEENGNHVTSLKPIPNGDILLALNFEDLGTDISITKQLTHYDQRCYIAIGALYKAGNNYITPSQIYYAMGYNGTPGTKDLNDINKSVTKLRATHIYIDNKMESEATKGGYERFIYDDSLLPAARVSVISRGKLTNNAIMPHGEPPLIAFARMRKQITTIPRGILVSDLNKTDANLRLEAYFIDRISHMKRGRAHTKMLYDTIFLQCNVTTQKQKKRTLEKIRKLLNGYIREKWILDYKEEQDGIKIILPADKKKNTGK